MADTRCRQAWHMGLPSGQLVECRFWSGHRGQRRNEDSSLSWSGKLTSDEVARADQLRRRAAES